MLALDRTGGVVGSRSARYALRAFPRSILARPSSVSKAAPRGPAFAKQILSCVAKPSHRVPLPPVRHSKSRTPTQTLNQSTVSVGVHDFYTNYLQAFGSFGPDRALPRDGERTRSEPPSPASRPTAGEAAVALTRRAHYSPPGLTPLRRTARRTAARRLPASAFPCQAMSPAVPWSTLVRTTGSPRVVLTAESKASALRGM